MARKKKAKIDVRYQKKQKAALRRNIRKTVFLNQHEVNAINLYRKKFGVRSLSALIVRPPWSMCSLSWTKIIRHCFNFYPASDSRKI